VNEDTKPDISLLQDLSFRRSIWCGLRDCVRVATSPQGNQDLCSGPRKLYASSPAHAPQFNTRRRRSGKNYGEAVILAFVVWRQWLDRFSQHTRRLYVSNAGGRQADVLIRRRSISGRQSALAACELLEQGRAYKRCWRSRQQAAAATHGCCLIICRIPPSHNPRGAREMSYPVREENQ
jgi:hypothetical protein